MTRLSFLLVLCVACKTTAQPPAVKHFIETKEKQTFSGEMSFDVSCKTVQATEWSFFVAQAPDLPAQSNVKTTVNIKGITTKELSYQARPITVVIIPVRQPALINDAGLTVTYTGTLKTRQLKELPEGVKPPAVTALTAIEKQLYTKEAGEFDFSNAGFKKWQTEKKFIKAKDENELELARRVLLGLRKDFSYEYTSSMDRKASSVCKGGKSDCGGLSILFCSVLRANKIPARTLFGRWAKSAKAGESAYFEWHVKAEFFADGIGWVPVEVSSAVSDKNENAMEECFGKFHGDFVTFHIDPNLILPNGGTPSATHNLQTPSWFVKGRGDTTGSKT